MFFYLRIVVMMYMTEEAAAPARPRVSLPAMTALALAMLATFYLGVLPRGHRIRGRLGQVNLLNR